MKKLLSAAIIFSLSITIFTACHKDRETVPSVIRAERFFADHGSHPQRFTGNASSGFTVTGKKGTRIAFPADAFVDAAGNVVSGTVEIGIIEILTKKDLLLSGVATEANGQLLESGGELYIEALQNGVRLYLNPENGLYSANPVRVSLPRDPAGNPTGMMLFKQGPRYDQELLEDDSFTWIVFKERSQELIGPYSYDFEIPEFGWINVDRFLGLPADQLTFVHVQLTPGSASGLQDVAVLMVFENLHSVIGLNYDPATQLFGTESFSLSPNIPIGEQIAVVVIAKDTQDNLYFAKQDNITVAANDTYTLTPQPATLQDIDWLNNL